MDAATAVEQAAAIAEAWGDHYPVDVFGEHVDARTLDRETQAHVASFAAWAMRHAARMIAQQIREEWAEHGQEVQG